MRMLAIVALSTLFLPASNWAQKTPKPSASVTIVEQPNAQRTRDELANLLGHYPPSLRNVLTIDPALLDNEGYLAPYPALANFLSTHPEVARNPGYYLGSFTQGYRQERESPRFQLLRDTLTGLAVFAGFAMAIGLLGWIIRTAIDYRRWNRLTKVQTDVHTKLLDRFATSEELLSYIQSPAGAKFLESSPIRLDAGPKSVGAPLGRILWSVQAGVVLLSAGIGLAAISGQVSGDVAPPVHAIGMLGAAVGLGFLISAGISFAISHRLGLIEKTPPTNAEGPGQA